MILIKNATLRYQLSLLISLSIAVLTVFTFFYAEVFRTKPLQKNEIVFPLPFRDFKKNQLTQIIIQNKNGQIEINKNNQLWYNADNEVKNIDTVINSFFNLRIRNLLKINKDNLKNYSLDKPYSTLYFVFPNKTIKAELGLLNSVDNSQYILFSHLDFIYQVDQFKIDFDQFSGVSTSSNLVFNQNPNEISHLSINNEKGVNLFQLQIENEILSSSTHPNLSSIDLRSKLLNILQIKYIKNIQQDIKDFDIINNYLKFPLYELEITALNKKEKYIITSPLIEIKSLDVAKDQVFVIKTPQNELFLIEASQLLNFQTN